MKKVKGKDLNYIPASHEDKASPGVLKKILLSDNDIASGKVKMVNWAYLPMNLSFNAHYHEDMDEVFVIVKGEAIIWVNSEKENLTVGDAVYIPCKAVHKMTSVGNSNTEYLVIGISKNLNGKTIVCPE